MSLYIDVYVLLNFFCDLASLAACARVLSLRPRPARAVAAAAFLGVYPLFPLFAAPPVYVSLPADVVCLAVGCVIAFGYDGLAALAGRMAVFFAGCVALGGIAGWICGYSSDRRALAVCLAPLVWFIWNHVIKAAYSKICRKTVTVTVNGKKLRGLCDSGDLLTEPEKGRRVIIANASALSGAGEIRGTIPVTTPAGSGELPYFLPDAVTVGKRRVDAAVALDMNDGIEYDCVVPPELVQ